MNLGMLLAWEQVYLLKVKKTSPFHTEEEVRDYLKFQKSLDDSQIQAGFEFYEMAEANFDKEQWANTEQLFEILDLGRDSYDVDDKISAMGKVLWEMGDLFGTNWRDNYH